MFPYNPHYFVALPEKIVATIRTRCSVWKKGARLDMALHMARCQPLQVDSATTAPKLHSRQRWRLYIGVVLARNAVSAGCSNQSSETETRRCLIDTSLRRLITVTLAWYNWLLCYLPWEVYYCLLLQSIYRSVCCYWITALEQKGAGAYKFLICWCYFEVENKPPKGMAMWLPYPTMNFSAVVNDYA